MELLLDFKVREQFQKLVTTFLTKNQNYDMSKFIGGLPVTLERKDVSNLISKDDGIKSKYTVTQKVDGTRVLMYVGPDSETAQVKQRTGCFIDRNMKVYTIRNDTRDILPYVNSREMLLDGELVFFDQEGYSHKELESRYVKGVSFMAFDILFGPENIDISTDDKKIMGQEFSMMVPDDGNIRSLPWTYINRYDILHKLIIPSKFNKSEPVLTEAFKSVNWFNIELKPIYFIDNLKNNRVLYNDSKTGYLQTLLSSNRKEFYNYLLSKYNKQINVFIRRSLKLDGLIFTKTDTLYNIGSWDKSSTVQYKWKPAEEQTVDLLIRKISSSQTRAGLYVSKGGKIEPYQINYKQVVSDVPNNLKDNDVAEFTIDKSGNFIYKELRKDKKFPNALKTVLNVVNSFKNPVNINDLYYFLNLTDNSKKQEIRKVLEYSDKPKLLKCITNYKVMDIIEPKQLQLINDMIKNVNVNKEIEVELRFGLITQRFNPKISRIDFLNIMRKVENYKFTKSIDDFVDIYKENIRTRYIYSKDFGRYILLESIIKNRISNVDISMKELLNHDVRIAMSSEVKVKKYNIEGDTLRKYRTSYTEPGGLFRLDFTAITGGEYSDRIFKQSRDTSETFQIEIEFLKNDIDVNNLFKFIINMLGN